MTQAPQYLLALYIAQHRADPPVSSGTVAEMLDRSGATASETFQRLDECGLVDYEPYEGATLTEEGWERAAQLHETYVTLSWFFRDALELSEYETEAMRLASDVSTTVSDQLAAAMLGDELGEE